MYMEWSEWKEKYQETHNPLLLEFLHAVPWVFEAMTEEMWNSVSTVLDMIPETRTMKGDAFELYAQVILAMDCFDKRSEIGEELVKFLKASLNVKYEARFITSDDILNLKIILANSKGVMDFLSQI